MHTLSKSKLMAFRQCPKRLWLEVHHPDLGKDSSATQASFAVGHQVGDIAQRLYDPVGKGVLINPQTEGFDAAFARTQNLLQTAQPVFEAGFRAEGALAFADVMLPVTKGGQRVWRIVEVKSSTSVKDCHRDDVAVQAFLAQACGVPLSAIALAHIDNSWVYPGDNDYTGLLLENDLTTEAFSRADEVRSWITEAQQIVTREKAPLIATGKQCSIPYECRFYLHCKSQEPQAELPIHWLPGKLGNQLVAHIEATGAIELRDAPDELLTDRQQRVKAGTLSGKTYFDQAAAAQTLASHKLPAYFMDFETIQFAIPIWKGTGPSQAISLLLLILGIGLASGAFTVAPFFLLISVLITIFAIAIEYMILDLQIKDSGCKDINTIPFWLTNFIAALLGETGVVGNCIGYVFSLFSSYKMNDLIENCRK